MKYLVSTLLALFLFIGCWNDIESYMLGRSLYYTFEANLSKGTVDKLENRFNQLLSETANVQFVQSHQMVDAFNDMAMIIAIEYENPYGLMGDLNELLMGAGTNYNEDGSMSSLSRPIPVGMPRAFSRGWKNSKLKKSIR